MNPLLKSLRFQARRGAQWISTDFRFGTNLTVLHGPNGSGKTPVIKGIVYALGYPIELTPEVRASFESIEVVVSRDAEDYSIKRIVDSEFEIVVSKAGSKSIRFEKERDFTKWFLELLAIPLTKLTDRGGNETIPYVSVLIPGLYVDQDLGWRSLYAPAKTKNFIKDQEQEVLRILLGVPAKNPYRNVQDFAEAKSSFDLTSERISSQQRLLEKQRADLGGGLPDAASLESRKTQLTTELQGYKSGVEVVRQKTGNLDAPIEEQSRLCERLRFELSALEGKRKRLAVASNEIASETQLVWLNAVAADAFRAFCGKEHCGLFKGSEESFGNRLLYLRDQIKDIESSSASIEIEIQNHKARLTEAEAKLKELSNAKEAAAKASGVDAVLRSIEILTKELAEVSLRLEKRKALDAEERTLDRMIEQREQIRVRVDELKPGRRARADSTADIRGKLRENLHRWLSTLGTQNLAEPIILDEEFRLFFDKDRFTETSFQSGSTRTRIVLAFHAALLETSIQEGGNHPGILIFDAPRQHELDGKHLAAYLKALKKLSLQSDGRAQVVLSVSDLPVKLDHGDAVWRPGFDSPTGPRYFGSDKSKQN
ncbi:hypothetical protein [Hyalangium gracile]|uniref:hypothetical protein n=1 Tax=Hyalangium gracile TaxID=394092 RepID=UPI001CC9947C|nr:hypothetical protein [Hyalangium gracile]